MKYKVGDKVRIVSKWRKDCHENDAGRMDKWLGKVMTISKIYGNCYRMKEDENESLGGWYWYEAAIAGLADNHKIVITSNGSETLARLYEDDKVIKTATAKCSPDDTFDFETGAKIAFDRLTENKLTDKWRVVNRPAKVGDYIRLKAKMWSFNEVGDILQISALISDYYKVRSDKHPRPTNTCDSYEWCYDSKKCEVVEPIDTPEEKPKYYNGKIVCTKCRNKDYTVGKVYEVVNGKIKDDEGNIRPANKSLKTPYDYNGYVFEFVPLVE